MLASSLRPTYDVEQRRTHRRWVRTQPSIKSLPLFRPGRGDVQSEGQSESSGTTMNLRVIPGRFRNTLERIESPHTDSYAWESDSFDFDR